MAVTEIDERALVRAYQAGNERAFDTIVRTQHKALYAHAYRRLNDHESAEDAVQDTLLRAYRALPNLDGDLALRAWLHRILTNVCHDERDRRRRRQDVVDRVQAEPEEVVADPADEAIVFDSVRLMAAALEQLPDRYREALVLRYVDGLSFREVGEASGTTEENARARAHRGRLALHKILSRVVVVLALVARGLRRSQESTVPSGPTEQALGPGVSDHAMTLTTQLTSHIVTAAPTVSRLAEVGSSFPGGKSALAAAAVTAVAAVSLPVAVHTVNESPKPPRPPAAVAEPVRRPGSEVSAAATASTTTTTAVAVAQSTTTSSSLVPSLARPFEPTGGPRPSSERAAVTTTSTTSTTVAPVPITPEGRLEAPDVAVTGDDPQYAVSAPFELTVGSSVRRGSLVGHLYVDGSTAFSDDLAMTIDGTTTTLRLRGEATRTTTADGVVEYTVNGPYVWKGASGYGLSERAAVRLTFRRDPGGPSAIALVLGQGK